MGPICLQCHLPRSCHCALCEACYGKHWQDCPRAGEPTANIPLQRREGLGSRVLCGPRIYLGTRPPGRR